MLKGLSQGQLAWQCKSRVGARLTLALAGSEVPGGAPVGREGWSALLSLWRKGRGGGPSTLPKPCVLSL